MSKNKNNRPLMEIDNGHSEIFTINHKNIKQQKETLSVNTENNTQIIDFDYQNNTMTGLGKNLTSEFRTESLNNLAKNRGMRLRVIRQLLNKNLQEFSQIVGIEHGSLGRTERGHTCLSILKAKNICENLIDKENFMVNPIWLLTGKGTSINKIVIKNTNISDILLNSWKKKGEIPNFLQPFTLLKDAYVSIHKKFNPITMFINDHHMSLIYSKGDMVGGYCIQKSQYDKITGQPCIVILKNGNKMARIAHYKEQMELFILSTVSKDNGSPQIITLNELQSIAIINFSQKTVLQSSELVSKEEDMSSVKVQIEQIDNSLHDNIFNGINSTKKHK